MQFKGIVTLQALDANTMQPIGEVVEENIITEAFGRRCFPAWELSAPLLDLDIVLYSGNLEPSIYPPTNYYPSSNGYTRTTRSGDVFGVARRELIEGSGNNPDIIQYSARFSPPATGQTRNIVSVALNRLNDAYIPAFTKLATPCVQTDSQIYDVYYRILVTYDENSVIDKKSMRLMLKRSSLQTGFSYYSTMIRDGFLYPLPSLVVNNADKSSIFSDDYYQLEIYNRIPATKAVSAKRLPYATKSYQYGFDDGVGVMMRSKQFDISPGWPYTYKSKDLFEKRSKIQNVFGYKLESTNVNSHPFLDVDNLATGSGSLSLSGAWQDEETTANKELYFETLFPERNTIKITNSGAIGVSQYQYVKEKYLTQSPLGGSHSYPTTSKNHAVGIYIHALMSQQSSTAGDFHNPPRSLIGDIGEVSFGVEQVSASIAFDKSSILICKADKVILYNLASSRYWIITGAFTNIHQLAVRNGVVYIACRNTGLYTCNPRVNLVAQPVTVTGYRTADFTNCHGVSIGHNNKVWAVGKDALASYDGTSWTVYDNTTTPQFTTNTTTYARVEYLKSITDGVDDQLFFVYRDTDATAKIGFWWSPATASVVETADWARSGSSVYGNPRKHRQHVKVTSGVAYIMQNNAFQKVLFNTSAFISVTTVIAAFHGYFGIIDNKINGQKNLAVYYHGNLTSGGATSASTNTNTKVYDNSNTLVLDIQANDQLVNTVVNGVQYGVLSKAMTFTYGTRHQAHKTVIELNGIFVSLQKPNDSVDKFTAILMKAPYLLPHQQGGSLAYLCRDTYGWDGSQWVLNHPGSKATHSTPQVLMDGVNIAFNEGTVGTSFVSGNHYKFGLCSGLLKDNATRCKYTIPEILVKSASGVVPLTSNTVPAPSALATGVVGIHAVHKSKNAFVNGNFQVVFPGNTDGQFAAGDKQVTGDFHLTIQPFANPALIGSYTTGINPSGVTYDSTNNAVWVSNYGSNTVSKFDAATGALIGTYTGFAGTQCLTYDLTNNAVWVVNWSSSTVTKLNAATGALIGTYNVGTSPYGIAYDSTNNAVWVSNYSSNTVTKLNAATGALIGTYNVGTSPRGVAYDLTNNAVWVVNQDSNTITKLNASNGSVIGTYSVGTTPRAVTYDSTSNAVWVTNTASSNITKLNATTGALIGTYAVSSGMFWIAYDNINNLIYTSSGSGLSKINPNNGSVIVTYPINSTTLAIDPSNGVLWVTDYSNGKLNKVNPTSLNDQIAVNLTNSINRTIVGIGKRHRGGVPMVGIVITSTNSAQLNVSTVAPFDTSTGRSTPYTWSGLNASSVIGIKRVGSTITATLNGVNVYTVDTSGTIAASDKRLDVMFATHYWSIGNAFRTDNSTCPVATIETNGTDNAVMFGNEVAGTEAFDIRCKGVVFELGATAKLDGVDAVVKFNSTDPVPGEIAIDAETLTAVFNNVDVGKTIEIDCTRVWDL